MTEVMTEEETDLAAQQASALKIQAISRGRKSRRSPIKKKQVNKNTDEENAASRLQAMQRGKNSRKRVIELKEVSCYYFDVVIMTLLL